MSTVQNPVVDVPNPSTSATLLTTTLPLESGHDMKTEGVVGSRDGAVPLASTEPTSVVEDKTAAPATTAAPVTEGVLGYKAPGLVKSLRFSKKHFWFGDEAVDIKDLHSYLRGEKPELAHHNAAWSTHTGKGLLYFAKNVDQKSTPAGIINLTDVSEVTKDGAAEFHFKLHGHKHSFQAASSAERDSWTTRIEAAAAEAKTLAPTVTESARYKEHREQLDKPVGAAVAPVPSTSKAESTPKKSLDKAAAALKKDDASSDSSNDEGKRSRRHKSRSVSRKRTSLFGALLGKKDESGDKKVEHHDTKPGDAAAETVPTDPVTHDSAVVSSESAAVDHAQAVAARVVTQPVLPVTALDEAKPATTTQDGEGAVVASPVTEQTSPVTPKEHAKQNKRNSFFGSLFQRRDTASPIDDKKEKEVVPTNTAKEVDVSTGAPSLPAPVITSDVPSTEPVPIVAGPTTAEPAPVTPKETPKEKGSSAPKESFFGKFMRQEKSKHHDEKVDADKKPETLAAEPADTTVASSEAAAPVPASAATVETPVADTSTPTPQKTAEVNKDKRRTSFFNTLGSRKEKRSESAADADHADAEGKHKAGSSSSPVPKFGALFRKPSQGAKRLLDPSKKDTSSDAPAAKTGDGAADSVAAPPATASHAGTTATDDVLPATTATHEGHTPATNLASTGTSSTKPAPEVQATA